MGLFDFFKKKPTTSADGELGPSEKLNIQPIESKISLEELDQTVEEELEVGDFGGAKPSLTLRKSGTIYLIVEVPPFYDGDGNEIDGDEDFPEVMEFENLIAEYIGTPVDRDDREVFVIKKPNADTLIKVKEFIENYWTLRKDIYKKK
jgi:hypothetical protein